jgi:hypothetical protein
VIAEVYPALWSKAFPTEGRKGHQHDANSVARWMQQVDKSGALAENLHPHLCPKDKAAAEIEGWILGLA